MTILYVLGSDSKYNNEEIRYSIRSVAKHLPVKKIFIVGEKPSFVSDEIIHIPFAEANGNKAYRIAMKIRHACEIINEPFYLFADDYFILKPLKQIGVYSKGRLNPSEVRNHIYKHYIYVTEKYLIESGNTTHNFDCHRPFLIDPEKFKLLDYVWHPEKTFVVKSIYGNLVGSKKFEVLPDPKKNKIDYSDWMFSSDDANWRYIRDEIRNMFNTKTKYEL